MQHGVCVFSSGRKGPGSPTEYRTSRDQILRILRYPRYIYTAKTLYGDTGELIIEELLQRGEMTMSGTVKTVADRLTQNMEGQYFSVQAIRQNKLQNINNSSNFSVFPAVLEGRSMDYSEVSSTFCKLIETHFLQRCPPMVGTGTTGSTTPAAPANPGTVAAPVGSAMPSAESFPDCYKVPQITLIGRGKRQLSAEDGEDQRNAKRARMDSEVGVWNQFATENFNYLLIFLSLTFNILMML